MAGDINGIIDIEIFIDEFIKRLKKDKILATRLDIYINGRLKIETKTMYSFWNKLLFARGFFKGKPFQHIPEVVIEIKHYEKLIKYFKESIDENYSGVNAELAKSRAQSIALFFMNKTLA